MDLSGKTVLITGASRGIGRYMSVYLGGKCGNVIGIGRNEDGLRETARVAAEAGAAFTWHVCDLTREENLATLAEELRASGEKVDVLIHNAADVTSQPLRETSLGAIDHLVHANVTGPLQLTKLLLPLMAESERPSIVTISSLAGYKPNPTQTVYSITKSAVNAMADALRAELGADGFLVLNVALSSVGTESGTLPGQVPLKVCAQKIEQAIRSGQSELFLSPVSKWLMRLYAFWPALAHRRV